MKAGKFFSAVLGVTLLASLCACGENIVPYTYDDAEDYLVGTAQLNAASISSIEIDWIAGSVEIIGSDTAEQISISETSSETEGKYSLRYMVDRGELKIKYMQSGVRYKSFMEKNLSVTVPTSALVSSYEVDSISASVSCVKLSGECDLSSVSGNVSIVSSRISAEVETVSGKVMLGQGEYGTVDVETVSGEVVANAGYSINGLFVKTVSGGVTVNGFTHVGQLLTDTVSGNVSYTIKAGTSFELVYASTSGSVIDTFGCEHNGNVYRSGDGAKKFRVNTVSGNLRLEKFE